mmetsp:Transcript_23066/g.39014  ORF Transcript_23066/g.39014 Transcript_23066/m.39014 type:complete len:150 (+) Transcript_23066:20-469(+)
MALTMKATWALLLIANLSQGFMLRTSLAVRTAAILSSDGGVGQSDTPVYALNVDLFVKEDRRAEFIQVIQNNQAGTLGTERLVISFDWGEDTSERNTFHFHEQYAGEDGFKAHTQTPHFAAWEAFASSEPTPFTAPPQVKFYTLEKSNT